MAKCEVGYDIGAKIKKRNGVFVVESLNEEGEIPSTFVKDPDAACIIAQTASRNYQDLQVGQAGITMGSLICERCGKNVQIGLRRVG